MAISTWTQLSAVHVAWHQDMPGSSTGLGYSLHARYSVQEINSRKHPAVDVYLSGSGSSERGTAPAKRTSQSKVR